MTSAADGTDKENATPQPMETSDKGGKSRGKKAAAAADSAQPLLDHEEDGTEMIVI